MWERTSSLSRAYTVFPVSHGVQSYLLPPFQRDRHQLCGARTKWIRASPVLAQEFPPSPSGLVLEPLQSLTVPPLGESLARKAVSDSSQDRTQ